VSVTLARDTLWDLVSKKKKKKPSSFLMSC
jgi:hypothetical protein